MQVAILHDLRVQVRVLLTHELDGPTRRVSIHFLDDRGEVARLGCRVVHILGRFVQEIVSEGPNLGICNGKHQ